MNETYFLGANSKDGFSSLYAGFPGRPGDFLHIIKGGPGTGKSGFMRKIGKAAEGRGLDVQYVLCSGDPDSLDGVYIPALHCAWVDGTAPHVTEPAGFGADADYLNLGKFCRTPFSPEESEQVFSLNRRYKALYDRAYAYLAAAAALRRAARPALFGEEETAALQKRIDGILDRTLGRAKAGGGKSASRFLSALSCQGELRLNGEIEKLCKLIYVFDGSLGGADAALRLAARGAMDRGADVLLCPSPLEPERLEAVLLPQSGVAFADGSWQLEEVRRLRIDALVPAEKQQAAKGELKQSAKLGGQLLELACGKLKEAKALHDELEAVYKPHMDFPALTRFTENEIKKLLK